MNIILNRKREVDRFLKDVENYPASNMFKQELMTFCYVLVCGTIEFMIENTIEVWLDKTIKHHGLVPYRGRKYVQYFLDTQYQARKKNIERFHSTSLKEITNLINDVVGVGARTKFNKLIEPAKKSVSLEANLNERLKRITTTRHELAHGQKMPNEIQPNVSELREDFLFVYNHIIKNIRKCLPRV